MEQDVLGFDVAMNDPVLVGIRQRVEDFPGDPDRIVDPELGLAVEPGPEGLAVDEGHDVEEEAIRRAAVEEGQDVRVLQRGGGGDLLDEPLGAEDGGEFGFEDLHRHLAVVLHVLGQIDRGHPALAEFAFDSIAVGEGGVEAILGSGHGRIERSALPQGSASNGDLPTHPQATRPTYRAFSSCLASDTNEIASTPVAIGHDTSPP